MIAALPAEAKAAEERRAKEEAERAERLAQEKREREEREAAEAKEREARRLEQQRLDAYDTLRGFLEQAGDRPEFAKIAGQVREFLAAAEQAA